VNCVECGAPFQWRAPSPITGREQGWYRTMEESRKGWRCAERASCRTRAADQAAAAEATLRLFDMDTQS
jgi:hypothetical protein